MSTARNIAIFAALALLPMAGCPTKRGGPDRAFGGPLPGATPYERDLLDRLDAAWKTRPEDYRPRTKHLREDESPKYTNRLFLESSPYLRQHAHNPVNWYPWGDEAFATAKETGRPVLLSVGYSTCHWCHVMEEESFEDVEIATYLNEHYIAIKVDREERPDIDEIYMQAVRATTGGGGWPMTVWLNAERAPFFGATYVPPRDGDRGAERGFLSLLMQLNNSWQKRPQHVERTTEALTRVIRRNLEPGRPGTELPGPDRLHATARYYRENFDWVNGGNRRPPKFPSSVNVRLLLRHHRRTGNVQSLQMATLTLDKMAAGGIYDHVGGGFHRYSVDAYWLVPHFEKMLYDNALLAVTYLDGYQATGNADYRRVTTEILDYVLREMTSPQGGFYSATDADSLTPEGHREEGRFFTWTPAELEQALSPEESAAVQATYAVRAEGNFEGRSIFFRPRPSDAVSGHLKITPAELDARLASAREKLYEARAQRPAPLRDDKVLASWNGLMISAFARAGSALDEPRYVAAGSKAADFILAHMRVDGRLRRSYVDGSARHNAYLDDHAFLIAGLLDLFEATGEARWLREAIALDGLLAAHYEDPSGGYFLTSDDHEKLLARGKPGFDGAEPSGNSIQVANLLRLYELTSTDTYRQRAESAIRAVGTMLLHAPQGSSDLLVALDFLLDAPKQIVLVTPPGGDADAFLKLVDTTFLPNRVLVVTAAGNAELENVVPLIKDKTAQDGETTAYVCIRTVCEKPTRDPDVFLGQISKVVPLAEGGEGEAP